MKLTGWYASGVLGHCPVLLRVRTLLCAIALCPVLWGCAATSPLFDGRSLAGWQPSGDSQWRVQDGEIVGSGGDGFLLSEGLYDDFRLSLEFRVDATTNSGIFIRCRDRQRVHPETCYELNIWDQHPQQEARTGAIVLWHMPPLAQVNTLGRWNSYEVVARGPQLEVRVNGVLTARLEDADSTAGFIALQRWGEGTVRFRRIELQLL